MKRKIYTTIIIFGLTLTLLYSQNAKILEKKAKESVSKLDESLAKKDQKLALTEDQKRQIYSVYLDGEIKMKAAKEEAKTPEEKKELQKPIRQEMNANIRKNILTKEQRTALKKKKE